MSVIDDFADEVSWDASVREAVRAKYARERDKRLRPEGPDQYITVDLGGEYSEYLDDLYCEHPIRRDPVMAEAQAVVIGGGFSGLLSGARLREAGVSDVRVIEKASGFGGAWYWNRYPGCQCDTESCVYMPLLEEVGHIPSAKYAKAPEIFAHSQAIAAHYDLYRDALLQTEVTAIEWEEAGSTDVFVGGLSSRAR